MLRNIRWTVGRRVAAITVIGLTSAVLICIVAWSRADEVINDAERAKVHGEARALVQSLDTRSSELKVDAFKSVTFADPTIAQADVATRLAQPSTTGAVVEAISEPGSSAR